jgi:hypothetical protein
MERRILVNQTFKNPKKFRRTNRSMNRSTIIADNTLITSSPPNQPPFLFFEATGPVRGYDPRAGPVGSVWGLAPGRCGRAGISPYDPPGPALRDRKVSRGPVEAEGGSLGGK